MQYDYRLNSMSNNGVLREEANVHNEALGLYSQIVIGRWVHKVLSLIQHNSRKLMNLNNTKPPTCRKNRHFAGQQSIAIDKIKGTDGRESDFDNDFYPLQDRLRSRWLGVASARLSGKELPPVEVINMGGTFYVQDGHHRISVARALGEQFIDAEVINLDC